MDGNLYFFYGWWQFAVCLFAFFALIAIWWQIGKKQNDFGQVWLALSILAWAFSGLLEVYFAVRIPNSGLYLESGRSILSLFNSLFILLALPWFRYLPKPLAYIIKGGFWRFIVGVPFLFCLAFTLHKLIAGREYGYIQELDVYYAIFTLVFLGGVLWESFAKRRLKVLSWLSLVCILIILVAQFFKLSESEGTLLLFSAIFKTSLIMLFFALALSWVKELAENIIPKSANLSLVFSKEKDNAGKWMSTVLLNGFPGTKERKLILSPRLHALLLEFAQRCKNGEDPWLEIKPKNFSVTEKTYDIGDYNQIKRLLNALLDGLFGKDNWTREQHLIPLKNTLFEMSESRNRKIRMILPPENIFL
ncbi:hypothetical protein [Flagellimonas myxillae]|uniref:hypothetical protein n=1 Tax=Flagellimonas myxillae TaxID=2942214 RepID=UPI00201F6C5B|nr:hypothetical protein [Muricauda myxillae]MCL6267397.1 hypothetical protein [Muricauda myxillae]